MQKRRIIKDCLYGYINVPELCHLYIDVPEFQRLRRIKQLGNVSRVYPSATHTRFEHCIGVMHLAGIMADILNIDTKFKQLIQLAGLYHDIGHLAYSHLFDTVLAIINPKDILCHHEDRSVATFLKVSNRLGLLTEIEQKFICACIKGETIEGYDKYLFQIVSSEIDVDKLDYLCRDAYHTGMPSFHANYIIMNARIGTDKSIVFRSKSREDIKNMFETRRRMHELVYQHPVSLQYDTIYICMILQLSDELIYDELCDYKLDALLMTNPRTREIYRQLETRKKNHDDLCRDKTHPIHQKHIPNSGCLNDIKWVESIKFRLQNKL